MIRIAIDDKIPFLQGVLEPFAEIRYRPGNQISKEDAQWADAFLIRTRTQCNGKLLANSGLQFIGSATIGTDHIDTQWCEKSGIAWTNAPGCNADSVEQYISAALFHWAKEKNKNLSDQTIGIIGVGNVGKRVAEKCSAFGMRVLLNDPPRERAEGSGQFSSLQKIAEQADIMTFHVPLYQNGTDPTWHLVNETFLSSVKNGALLLNSCRGEVFDTAAILKALSSNAIDQPIIDCWENEPDLNLELMKACLIATPHIAGYSQDGKANGSSQVVQALAKHFALPLVDWLPSSLVAPDQITISTKGKDQYVSISDCIHHCYPIWEDDKRLRNTPENFELQRGDYPLRREYKAYQIDGKIIRQEDKEVIKVLGFKIL